MDIVTGNYTISEGPMYQFMNSLRDISNQLRAPNGRIFFFGTEVYGAYYDPADRAIHQLGKLVSGNLDNAAYSMNFDYSGSLYIGTQAVFPNLPAIIRLNPSTLSSSVVARVGENPLSYAYAYQLYADPPWVYVAVGQNPWKLVALNINTGVQTILGTRDSNGFIALGYPGTGSHGLTATMYTNQGTPEVATETVWIVDGQTFPFSASYNPATLPFTPRNVLPASNPLIGAPTVNTSAGTGLLTWTSGSSTFQRSWEVQYTRDVPIESLTTSDDQNIVIGNAEQYSGFFKHDLRSSTLEWMGNWHGISQGPRLLVDGKIYICGYPLGSLSLYDPDVAWDGVANPVTLGNFSAADAHYAACLAVGPGDKLFFSGRRERDGEGGAVGVYDRSDDSFSGHHTNLNFLNPVGLAVVNNRVIYSGILNDDPEFPGMTPTTAQLVEFDLSLTEVDRHTIITGMVDTGQLFTVDGSTTIIGVSRPERLAYRYDVVSKQLLAITRFSLPPDPVTQSRDGSIWVVQRSNIVRLNPFTLGAEKADIFGSLEPETMAWVGNTLVFSVGATLYKTTLQEEEEMSSISISSGGMPFFSGNPNNVVIAPVGQRLIDSGTGIVYAQVTIPSGQRWVEVPEVFRGLGSPEGVVTSVVGGIYARLDGGAGSTLYVKESGTGATGWVAK